jgi:hypothetical protein
VGTAHSCGLSYPTAVGSPRHRGGLREVNRSDRNAASQIQRKKMIENYRNASEVRHKIKTARPDAKGIDPTESTRTKSARLQRQIKSKEKDSYPY